MNVRWTRQPWLLWMALAWVGGADLHAQLLARTPFDSRPPAPPRAEQPLEYLGFIQSGDGLLFRVRHRERKAAAFLHLNVYDDELEVTARQLHRPTIAESGLEARGGALTVEHLGRLVTLREPKPRVRPSAPSPPGVPPRSSAYLVSPAVTAAVVLHQTAATEKERMDAIVAEIRRRQEERAKADAATR